MHLGITIVMVLFFGLNLFCIFFFKRFITDFQGEPFLIVLLLGKLKVFVCVYKEQILMPVATNLFPTYIF